MQLHTESAGNCLREDIIYEWHLVQQRQQSNECNLDILKESGSSDITIINCPRDFKHFETLFFMLTRKTVYCHLPGSRRVT